MPDKKQHPYINFYGRDWLGDSMLRMCNTDERGVWIDLLCVMMAGEPYGHLAINNRPMTDSEVARIIGLEENTYKGILYRLEEKGIPSRSENGMIFSRRLVRDHKRFMDGKKYGAKGGGNPALRKKKSRIQNPESIPISITKGGIKGGYIGLFEAGIIPQNLQNQDFAKAWDDWILFRIEKKKPVLERSATSQLKHLSKMGCSIAIECIEQSIRNDWQGLFEVKSESGKRISREPCI